MAHSSPSPLFKAVIAPCITPVGALNAVLDGSADVAPIDSYAFDLLERFAPQWTARVRVIGSTVPTPIPPLVASTGHLRPDELSRLRLAFRRAHEFPATRQLMDDLLLTRFDRPDPAVYAPLRLGFASAKAFWHTHALAADIHPAFMFRT